MRSAPTGAHTNLTPDRLPQHATALVEVPLGAFIKRELHGEGRVDYISPLPCPFNYGCLPDQLGADGDPPDALILGPRLPLGARVQRPVWGVVRFLDAGLEDDKLILADRAPSRAEQALIRGFFTLYGPLRAALNALRGRQGRTGLVAIELRPP